MRVIVVGAGEVGFHTAERLSAEGHDVTLVEGNRQRLREVEERLNVLALHGNGAQADTLEEAGIRSCDIFIAVTDVDEVNLVACLLAREYGATTKIARVKSLGYTSKEAVLNAEKLGIELLINPLEAVANDLVRIAEHAAAVEVAEFADGRVLFVGYPIGPDSPVRGLSLSDLKDLRSMYPFLVTAITRAGRTLIPRGGDVIETGDHVFIVMRRGDLPSVRYLLGFEKRQVRRVFVLGGGEIGFRVAQRLEAQKLDVRIADPDRSVCARLAERLGRTVVLHAELTDVQSLGTEGLGEVDVVVATAESEETNILAALLAKRQGARRALCVVNRPAYVSLVPSLGIDACVSPRLSTASAILRYVRRGGVLSMATVEENDAEVVELLIEPSVGWLGQPLKSLPFPTGALLGAVVPGADAIIPAGDTVLQAGDRAVVFALPEAIVRVEGFFGVGSGALRNEELRFYVALALGAIAFLSIANAAKMYPNPFQNLRYSAFQAVSILTTTRFGTADYETWPPVCQVLLVLLMFIGGSAGSTAGGMKVSRALILVKHAASHAWGLVHPKGVRILKIDNRPIPDDVLKGVLSFFALYLAATGVGTLAVGAAGVEPVTAVASVIACLGNIGPGLGQVGPADNYAHLLQMAKAALTFCMLLGRLELFTVVALFFPSAWRK